ncbi:hypothetical protein HMPREF9123_1966 [Neisseria bacilliformis ATCC BAA-1200]|uniref:Uncharacterized protein n=1 Tax=Neisseria bacilliformis ATCC BAA-1200 TaxID=888742 RepID=F2BE10_9NEIS|nr:hypothetical protein HMPREF9123_1966 [Neisseria bacilliformis ATCC BAA-1200]
MRFSDGLYCFAAHTAWAFGEIRGFVMQQRTRVLSWATPYLCSKQAKRPSEKRFSDGLFALSAYI